MGKNIIRTTVLLIFGPIIALVGVILLLNETANIALFDATTQAAIGSAGTGLTSMLGVFAMIIGIIMLASAASGR